MPDSRASIRCCSPVSPASSLLRAPGSERPVARQLALCDRLLFFFQAEDGIRGGHVTGVQTCALPISGGLRGTGAAVAGARCGEPEAMAGSPAESSTCVPQPIARPAASAPAPNQVL